MKRLLCLLAACGGSEPDTVAPIDAPRIMPPTPDAALSPAKLNAHAYAAVAPTAAVHESILLEVDVTNLGGTQTGLLMFDGNSSVQQSCPTLSGGDLCEVELAFAPDHAGDLDVQFSATADPGGQISMTLPVTAVAAQPLGVEPRSFAFGSVPLVNAFGDPTLQLLALRNNTAAPLGPIAFAIAGDPQFTVNDFDNCMDSTLPPDDLCRIQVSYRPTTTAISTATVSVTAGTEHADIPVSARGTALLIAPGFTSGHVVVPDAYVGTSGGARQLTITNVSASAIGPLAVSITHADGSPANELQMFQQNCVGAHLSSMQQCNLFIGLASLDAGMKSATLKISSGTTSESVALVGYVVDRD